MPHDDPDEASLFHEGIELFNAGAWFDAHETWEEIWHLAGGERKRFYQGLVQCAVVLEHIRRGNPRGVRSVFKTAVTKFDGLPGEYMGLEIPRFLAAMRSAVEPILNLPDTAFDPARERGQTLPFDPKMAPIITLERDPFADQ